VATFQAFVGLMTLAERRVHWSYEVWDHVVRDLSHRDGHKRAFAAQLLARLAPSDPENRMRRDFDALAAVTRDAKTFTARHALRSIWWVGLAGPDRAQRVLETLSQRFRDCSADRHASILRTDIVASLGRLFRVTGDPSIEEGVEKLIASERDETARRKQRASWQAATA
jgi:hypothetical protein